MGIIIQYKIHLVVLFVPQFLLTTQDLVTTQLLIALDLKYVKQKAVDSPDTQEDDIL